MDEDFDSEEEYGKEGKGGSDESESEEESGSNDESDGESEESEQPIIDDNYTMDHYLVRREAALLSLCLKGFNKRVIVFFNEKV